MNGDLLPNSQTAEPVSAIGLAPLVAKLRQLDIDSAPLLERTDIADADVFNIQAKIPRSKFNAFWNLALDEANDPTLAVQIGLANGFSHMGPVGAVLQNANDCHAALLLWNQYGRNVLQAPSFFLNAGAESAELTLERVSNYPPNEIRGPVEFMMFSLLNFSVQLSGKDPEKENGLTRIEFRHDRPAPEVIQAYKDASGIDDFEFGAGENRIIFRREYLDLPVPKADADALERMTQQADHLMRLLAVEHDIVERVIAAIRRRLIGVTPSIVTISRDCHMSRATLQRRLSAEGSGFQKLLDLVRQEMAYEYLFRHSAHAAKMSLGDISFVLGYSDTSAFCNAFKRWTGLTPLEYQNGGMR